MKTRGMLLYVGALAAVMAVGFSARADSVLVQAIYTGDSPVQNVNITTNPNIFPSNNGGSFLVGPSQFTTVNVSNAGSISTNLDTDLVRTSLGANFVGYCIDLAHFISPSTTVSHTWNVGELTSVTWGDNSPLSSEQAKAITYLWNTYRDDSNANHAAAFQMALWDLVYLDPTTGYTNSNLNPVWFSNNANIADAATEAKAAWDNRNDLLPNAAPVYALIAADGVQSFSVTIVGATTTPVPLPASAGVGLSMLVGCGILFGASKQLKRRARIA